MRAARVAWGSEPFRTALGEGGFPHCVCLARTVVVRPLISDLQPLHSRGPVARAAPVCLIAMGCSAWLEEQNLARQAARRAAGKAVRQVGGQGRELARQAWVERRSALRKEARELKARQARRSTVVGRVRLVGKGPPPRLGPLLPHSRGDREHPPLAPEPIDSGMFFLLEQRMREYDRWDLQRGVMAPDTPSSSEAESEDSELSRSVFRRPVARTQPVLAKGPVNRQRPVPVPSVGSKVPFRAPPSRACGRRALIAFLSMPERSAMQ